MEEPKGVDKRSKEYREWKEWDKEQLIDGGTSYNTLGTQPKGLGDVIASATKAIGIEPCEGCNKRKEWLNDQTDYIRKLFTKHKPNEFMEADRKLWEDFKERENQKIIAHEDQQLIIRLLKDVLNSSVKACYTCGAGIWKKYINMIDIVYSESA